MVERCCDQLDVAQKEQRAMQAELDYIRAQLSTIR